MLSATGYDSPFLVYFFPRCSRLGGQFRGASLKGLTAQAENADFQTTIADQRATQKLLTNALNVLKAVYAKKSFVQKSVRQEPAGPPPPPGFKKYEQSSGAGGVMGMIEQIIADAKTMEADAIKAETDSQKAYACCIENTAVTGH